MAATPEAKAVDCNPYVVAYGHFGDWYSSHKGLGVNRSGVEKRGRPKRILVHSTTPIESQR